VGAVVLPGVFKVILNSFDKTAGIIDGKLMHNINEHNKYCRQGNILLLYI